jgi:translocation protein SEC63
MPPGASPLLQLPYFTPQIAKAADGPNARTHKTVQEFMRLSDGRRRHLTVGPGLLSEEQYKAAMSVASQLPVLKVEKAFFKVVGERCITPNSLIQFVIKARIIPPGTTSLPDINPSDLEDVDPAEGDLDALHGRRKEDRDAEIGVQPTLAHAPYFARDHSPRWHLFLADGKQNRIAVPPATFTKFDKPLVTADGKPTFNVQTLRMQFGAPPHAGQYTFVMHLVCDSYVGMDTKMEVTLVVDEPSRAEEIQEEAEISEPEEG